MGLIFTTVGDLNLVVKTQFDWLQSAYATQYFAGEEARLQAALRQAVGPSVLQVGKLIDAQPIAQMDLPFLIRSTSSTQANSDVVFDAAFMPFPEKSLACVVLPHVLEQHELPHQVLREAYRVLQSDGHLILTGFNPISLLGMQRKFRRKAALPGRYYSCSRVIDWLQLLDFEVVCSVTYQHAPLSKRPKTQRMFAFLESVGDRILPMFGGAYMITAKKREAGMMLLGEVKYTNRKTKLATATPAKSSLKANRANRLSSSSK